MPIECFNSGSYLCLWFFSLYKFELDNKDNCWGIRGMWELEQDFLPRYKLSEKPSFKGWPKHETLHINEHAFGKWCMCFRNYKISFLLHLPVHIIVGDFQKGSLMFGGLWNCLSSVCVLNCSKTFSGVALANLPKGFIGSKAGHLTQVSEHPCSPRKQEQYKRYKSLFQNDFSFQTFAHVQPVPVCERTNPRCALRWTYYAIGRVSGHW